MYMYEGGGGGGGCVPQSKNAFQFNDEFKIHVLA